MKNFSLILGIIIILSLAIVGIFAPFFAPYNKGERDHFALLSPPTRSHIFGTDEKGVDLFSEIIYGGRVAFFVGFGSVIISLIIGLIIGMISGYSGFFIDEFLMRITEIILSFPGILLAIFLIFLTGKPSEWTVILALSVTGWAGFARLTRAQVLQMKQIPFVESAKAVGSSRARILFRHILPNIIGPIFVQATFVLGSAILAEASLSFLGLGPQNSSSWGAILSDGAVVFIKSPYPAIFSGGAIFLTVLGLNMFGDTLTDKLSHRV